MQWLALSDKLSSITKGLTAEDAVFVCIGTDRCTGDSLGPIVGTLLQQAGYRVFGTLEEPVHAENLVETLKSLPEGRIVIAVDACLAVTEEIGTVKVYEGGLNPGAGVYKDLPIVGDYHILGFVASAIGDPFNAILNVRLWHVIEMAQQIASAIQHAIPCGEVPFTEVIPRRLLMPKRVTEDLVQLQLPIDFAQ